MSGETGTALAIDDPQPSDEASYLVRITNGGGSIDSSATQLHLVAAPSARNAMLNLSTRGATVPGGNAMMMGVVLNAPATLLVRGVGPTLATLSVSGPTLRSTFNVSGAASSVALEIHQSGGLAGTIASNDGWSTNSSGAAIVTASQTVGAFPLSDGSHDSAILITLDPGTSTAMVRPSGDQAANAGIALAEAYVVP